MYSLLQDLRFGVRTLLKKPAFTAVALLTLMLGVGATTAIFTVVDAVLLRPLPFNAPDRLVDLINVIHHPGATLSYPGLTEETLDLWRSSTTDFLEDFQGYQPYPMQISGISEPKEATGEYVTGGLMTFLGVKPLLGRILLPDDGAPGRDHVVLLSAAFWLQTFGGDPSEVGKTITINKESFTVVGIMPREFRFPRTTDVWAPFSLAHTSFAANASKRLRPWVITRLRSGISIEQAQNRIDQISARLQAERPRPDGWGMMVQSVNSERASKDTRRNLCILLGAVAFVLAISCVNTGNMMLSQAVSREKEIAVRAALGAGQRRIVRQLLTESVLLSVAGGALGVIVASWAVGVITRVIPRKINFYSMNTISLDRRVLVFSFLVSVATGILFGILPALRASRANLSETMAAGGRGESGGVRARRLRNALVIAQVALSFVMLIGAGLLIKSFWQLKGTASGFDVEHLMIFDLSLARAKYPTAGSQVAFFEQAAARLAGVPGVRAVTLAGGSPLVNGILTAGDLLIEGHAESAADKNLVVPINDVAPNYFEVVGIALLQGRIFTSADGTTGAAHSVIINASMARHYWPNESPLGRRFRIGEDDWLTIVGVVGDVKQIAFNDRPEQNELYLPLASGAKPAPASRTLLVRMVGEPARNIPAIKDAIRSLDPDQPMSHINAATEQMDEQLAAPRFYTLLMGIFAGVALLLSAIGVYGVVHFFVSVRTREIGIRMALGAQPRDVLRTVVAQGLLLILVGIGLGSGGGLSLTRLLTGFLYQVKPADPATFAAASVLYLAVAFAAALIPARRAVRIDPLVALRE
jgi:putative ABC transport system permease protein